MSAKRSRLEDVRRILLMSPAGITFGELVTIAERDRENVRQYLKLLNARRIRHGVWTLDPTPDDVRLAEAIINRSEKSK